ncbi:MAG TPA: serine hydrolase [Xanthobacteraceae bacterium]|nr:serine hydrolase [Xanthobacteraceae bacterium]
MMFRASWPAGGLRYGLLALTLIVTLTAVASDPADARWRHRHFHSAGPAYSPPYAALVVDANSGRVLHEANADAPRHPASLTKIMTLYLLFEQIESGKLRLDSELQVSDHAAQQAPSKLGLQPGQQIAVEDAIRAVVTKSANDVAVVIAEAIGGDEEAFAKLMTRKARALGMARTSYVNASGLPDDDQITTARDQVTLGRAIQDRFPRYYRYFQTASFTYRGHAIRNHNHLLGRVEGIDGIKTGYTRASGFNLVSSVHRGGRHIVAAVLGGASAGARDARMRALIEEHIASASTTRTATRIAEAADVTASARPAAAAPATAEPRLAREDAAPVAVMTVPAEQPEVAPPAAQPAAAPTLAQAPLTGSTDPINPVRVKTITVKAGNVQSAALYPLVAPAPQATIAPPHLAKNAPIEGALPPPPGAKPGVLGVLPVEPQRAAVYQTASAASTPVSAPEGAAARVVRPKGPWLIQVGAFPNEAEAQERLREAQAKGKVLLARAEPFTEKFVKGTQEYYRARFDGLSQSSAEAACKYFKRNEIACLTIKN